MYRFFELMTEIAGWLLIAASPGLLGAGIGMAIYISNPTPARLYIGIFLAAIGLVIGIIWATRIYRKKGTIRFLSKIHGTTDLDEKSTDRNK